MRGGFCKRQSAEIDCSANYSSERERKTRQTVDELRHVLCGEYDFRARADRRSFRCTAMESDNYAEEAAA